jgi:hypothetical protein
MITITREALYRSLRAVEEFQCQDPTRFHLAGVHVEARSSGPRGELRLVATDGHTMAIAQPLCRVTADGTSTLPSATVAKLIRALRPAKWNAGHEFATAVAASGHVTITGWTSAEWDAEPGKAADKRREEIAAVRGVALDPVKRTRDRDEFPPWRAVVPEREAVDRSKKGAPPAPEYLCAAWQYVERAGAAARRFGIEISAPRGLLLRVPEDDLSPLRFDIAEPDTGDLTIVVMPMRQ